MKASQAYVMFMFFLFLFSEITFQNYIKLQKIKISIIFSNIVFYILFAFENNIKKVNKSFALHSDWCCPKNWGLNLEMNQTS